MPIVPSKAHETKTLIARLADPRPAGREAAVARLTLLGERAVPALAAAAESSDPIVRLGAIDALDRIGSRRGLDTLRRTLGDGDLRVASLAVLALGRLHDDGAQDAFEPLVRLLVDERAREELRLHALDSLRGLPERELRPLVARLAQTRRPRLRRAVGLLAHGGEPRETEDERAVRTIPALHREIQQLGSGTRRTTAATAQAKARIHVALARLESRIALYDLREMIEGRPVRAAGDLLEAASLIGDKSILRAVVDLAHDEAGLLEPCAKAFGRIVERERITRRSALLRAMDPGRRATAEKLWESGRVSSSAGRTRGPSR